MKKPKPVKPAKKKPIWDDDEAPAAVVKAPSKKSLWDDEEDDKPAAPALNPGTTGEQSSAYTNAKKPAKAPVELPPLKIVQTPADFHMIRCGEHRVVVLDSISADNKDLLCYSYQLKSSIHMKREDLAPKDIVDRAIETVISARQ